MASTRFWIASCAFLLAATGCESGTAPSTGPTSEAATPSESSATTTSTGSNATAREDPNAGSGEDLLQVGEYGPVGEWTVGVIQLDLDATDYCLGGDSFNDPPDGVYVLVRLDATYQGDTEGNAFMELTVAMVGKDGSQYSDTDVSGYWPDDMVDQPDVETGGQVEGNFCLDVPPEVLDGAVLFVEPTFSLDPGDRVSWATR